MVFPVAVSPWTPSFHARYSTIEAWAASVGAVLVWVPIEEIAVVWALKPCAWAPITALRTPPARPA